MTDEAGPDHEQVEQLGIRILTACKGQQFDTTLVTLAHLISYLLSEHEIDHDERMIVLNSLFMGIADDFKRELQ